MNKKFEEKMEIVDNILDSLHVNKNVSYYDDLHQECLIALYEQVKQNAALEIMEDIISAKAQAVIDEYTQYTQISRTNIGDIDNIPERDEYCFKDIVYRNIPERDIQIMEMSVCDNMPKAVIGKIYGISGTAVKYIVDNTIKKMRINLLADELSDCGKITMKNVDLLATKYNLSKPIVIVIAHKLGIQITDITKSDYELYVNAFKNKLKL